MESKRGRLLTSSATSILLCFTGFALFSRGFFPVKPLLPGYSPPYAGRATSNVGNAIPDASAPALAPFSRFVFVVIDALRSDFAFGPESSMDFVSRRALAILPSCHVLTLAKFGLRRTSFTLYRSSFTPYGYSSSLEGAYHGIDYFFVDTNVTRHLDQLLSQSPPPHDGNFQSSAPSDWDVLILHYLGLDHVGHLGGPNSPLMAPKQIEMDDIVQRLYFGLLDRDAEDGGRSLLVVVGDHGMTDMGNHGGSSEAEVAAALLLIAPSDEPPSTFPSPPTFANPFELHEVVHQIDLVPTLSTLLGLGIPRNSMGRIIESAVERYGGRDAMLASLYDNVVQIKEVLEAASEGAVADLVCSSVARRTLDCSSAELVTAEEMSTFLDLAQERLTTTFGDYHLWPMLGGLALLAAAAAGFVLLCSTVLSKEGAGIRVWVGAGLLAYLGTFFATSFIEEEHQGWYFVTTTILLLSSARPNLARTERASFLISAAGVRLMRAWPHNGQKAFPNDSVSSYLVASNISQSLLACATYAAFVWSAYDVLAKAAVRTSRNRPPLSKLLVRALTFAVLLVLSLAHILLVAASLLRQIGGNDSLTRKVLAALSVLNLDAPVPLAIAGYGVGAVTYHVARIVQMLDAEVARDLESIQLSAIALLLLSLTRPANIPLFLILGIQYRALAATRHVLSPLVFSTLVLSLQHVSFFAFGGSNSLATIDLSQAYNGVSSYQVHVVALLTFLSNFAGPVFWALASSTLLRSYPTTSHTPTRTSHLLFTSTFHALSLFTLALSATHFRRHLFTWTVFSPALLYKGVWSVLVHFGTDFVLSSLL